MTDEELEQRLSKIDKKLDKVLKLETVIAKALHLVPVSEKEERDIQISQRKNAATMQKIQEELAAMEPKKEESDNSLSFNDLVDASDAEIYSDVIANDYFERK